MGFCGCLVWWLSSVAERWECATVILTYRSLPATSEAVMAKKGEYLLERLPEDRKAYVHLVSGEKVDTQDLLTLAEAAKIADVTRAAVTKWVAGSGLGGRGKLKTVLIGKTPHTTRKWVEEVNKKRDTPALIAEYEAQIRGLKRRLAEQVRDAKKTASEELMEVLGELGDKTEESERKAARYARKIVERKAAREKASSQADDQDELEKKIEEQLGL